MANKHLFMGIFVGIISLVFILIFVVGVFLITSQTEFSFSQAFKGGVVLFILGIVGIIFSIYELKKYIKTKS